MPLLIEGSVPNIMGSVLPTLTGNYQARRQIQPVTSHDFSATRGKFVQLDRFKTLGDRGLSKLARQRNKADIIGTRNSEALDKTTRVVELVEFTGPSTTDGEASTLHLTREDMLYARNRLWDYGVSAFHEAIGSMVLADDYARMDDRLLVEEIMKCQYKFNPSLKLDNDVLATDKITRNDILRIREIMSNFNTQRFATQRGGRFKWLCSERQWRHLCEDERFYQFALAQIQGGNPNHTAQSPIMTGFDGQGMMAGGTGPQTAQPAIEVDYEGFIFCPSNTLPTRVVNTSGGARTANLGFVFGPGAVGVATGGRGPQVKMHNDTDFDRHFHFIHSTDGQYTYMLDDDASSGIALEVRTYAD